MWQAILEHFITLNGEFYLGGTCFEYYIVTHAKLVPVPNRELEFGIPKTRRKLVRDNVAVFIILRYDCLLHKKGNATEETVNASVYLAITFIIMRIS